MKEGNQLQAEVAALLRGERQNGAKPSRFHGPIVSLNYTDPYTAWFGEHDGEGFLSSGYRCVMVRRSFTGTWCGYVIVPTDHPTSLEDGDGDAYYIAGEDMNVHGGVTFSARVHNDCEGHFPHLNKLEEDGHARPYYTSCDRGTEFMFGFDSMHSSDGVGPDSSMSNAFHGGEYRTHKYVKDQTHLLAAQLRDASVLMPDTAWATILDKHA